MDTAITVIPVPEIEPYLSEKVIAWYNIIGNNTVLQPGESCNTTDKPLNCVFMSMTIEGEATDKNLRKFAKEINENAEKNLIGFGCLGRVCKMKLPRVLSNEYRTLLIFYPYSNLSEERRKELFKRHESKISRMFKKISKA